MWTSTSRIILSIVLLFAACQYWPVTVHISGSKERKGFSIQMPLKDKKRLEFFFQEVCFLNTWAYTLMGSKPESIDQYTKPLIALKLAVEDPDLKSVLRQCFCPPNLNRIRHFFTPRELKMKWGWETLNKYFSKLHNSKFSLKSFSHEDVVVLSIINKPEFIKVIKQHYGEFQEILKDLSLKPEELLEEEKLRLFTSRLNHDGLIGTVLGFGRENARLYLELRKSGQRGYALTSAWPDEELLNLELLNQKILSFQPWDLSCLFYPRFVCDPNSKETEELRTLYRAEREKIIQYFEGKDLVEAVLSLFNQGINTPSLS